MYNSICIVRGRETSAIYSYTGGTAGEKGVDAVTGGLDFPMYI